MAQSFGIPQPPPYKGENYRYPTVAIQSPYCRSLKNFNNKNGTINLRKGNELYVSFTVAGHDYRQGLHIVNYGSTAMFAMIDRQAGVGPRWYDITTSTPALVHNLAAAASNKVFTLYFNKYLFWMGDDVLNVSSTGPQYWNGTAWGTVSLTWPSSFNPYGGAVYKNRAYFINQTSAEYGYTDIDAVASPGTVTKVDLNGVISDKALLYIIRSISLSESVTAENVLAFLFSTGEVLVYGGSYPNSPNWGILSRFKISKPLFHGSYVDAKGDSFIFTDSEILSLRNLYAQGYEKERTDGIGAAIKPRWQQIIAAIPNTSYYKIEGVYDEANDRLIIVLPFYVDPETSAASTALFQLIYDFNLGAWYEYVQTVDSGVLSSGAISSCYFNDDTYIFAGLDTGVVANRHGKVFKLETKTTYLDDDADGSGTVAIPYKIVSAPYPYNKYGVMLTVGLEMIMKTDIYSTMNIKFIGDLGAIETGSQLTSGNGSNITKIFADVGIDSNIVQYEISGSSASSSIGLEIYSTNPWVAPSDGNAR